MKHPVFSSLIACLLGAATHSHGASPRPNFLFILADDHGYGDVSAYGAKDVRTPHIDRIGKEGIRFTTMRANCTVCSPSRAAVLTGKFADRVGVPGVIRTQPESTWGWFAPGEATLADKLRGSGYHTALIGKWHLGLTSPNTPNERGFDHFHGFLGDMMDSYTTHLRHGENYMRLNSGTITPQGHATDLFSDWTCEFLRQQSRAGTPFFLFLAYNAPHFPIQPPAESLAVVKARDPHMKPGRANNVAFVEHLDDGIGRVLTTLDETGLAQNTVVVFTSDNGGSLPHHQSNLPWRGGKEQHYDGGLRVPFLLRWPAGIHASSQSDHAGLIFDVFPTFLELAGADIPTGLDAQSLVPAIQGKPNATPRDLYFVRREGGRHGGNSYHAMIHGDWKLLRNDPFSPYELYQIRLDPQEERNLADQEKTISKDLSERLGHHIQRGGTVPWQPPAHNR
jgi:arylsulfatase A-like enzyme